MLLEGNVSVKAAILGNHRKVEKLYYDKHKNDKDLNFILQRAKEKGISKMSAQAVGQAVGSNKISILVPCHRVLGVNGKITGYGGGVKRKKALLELENISFKF